MGTPHDAAELIRLCDHMLKYHMKVTPEAIVARALKSLLEARPVSNRLDIILDWYSTLSPPAKARISIANLHDLSKSLSLFPTPGAEGGR